MSKSITTVGAHDLKIGDVFTMSLPAGKRERMHYFKVTGFHENSYTATVRELLRIEIWSIHFKFWLWHPSASIKRLWALDLRAREFCCHKRASEDWALILDTCNCHFCEDEVWRLFRKGVMGWEEFPTHSYTAPPHAPPRHQIELVVSLDSAQHHIFYEHWLKAEDLPNDFMQQFGFDGRMRVTGMKIEPGEPGKAPIARVTLIEMEDCPF